MSKWNKLSDGSAQAREAAFEAQVLAELKATTPKPPIAPAAPPPVRPVADGIQITLTAGGQTTRYENLDSVPLPLRQRIMNAWLSAPGAGAAPTFTAPALPATPTPRPRSIRVAIGMNLLLPGAGQFYFRQPGWGCFYALSFIVCFVATIAIFLRDYNHYLDSSAGGDILDAGNLEKLAQSFHTGTIGVLQVVALVIYIASTIHLFRSRPRG